MLRWLKFNVVGGVGIAVQLAALVVLRSGFHLPYLLATGLAVEAAVLHNFIWHEHFTWADRSGRRVLLRALRFNLTTGLFSIAGNLLLMRFLVGSLHLNYLVANIATIAMCSVASFLVSDRFVFQAEAKAPVPLSLDGTAKAVSPSKTIM